jgi:DNA-binding PadR family transcriptional regulator
MSDFLGEFEQLILLAVARLGKGAYGVSIRHELEERADRPASLGAVYVTLDRLEAKRFVASQKGEATPERGGRRKRVFRVTREGQAALLRTHRAFLRLSDGLKLRWQ